MTRVVKRKFGNGCYRIAGGGWLVEPIAEDNGGEGANDVLVRQLCNNRFLLVSPLFLLSCYAPHYFAGKVRVTKPKLRHSGRKSCRVESTPGL